MNWNELASEVTRREGKKVSVNVAQVKEVLHITRELLEEMPDDEILALIRDTEVVDGGEK